MDVSPSPRHRRCVTFLLALILSIALSGGCDRHGGQGTDSRLPPPAAAGNDEDPHWVAQANPHHKIAVVFIHGIFGGTTDTWRNARGDTFFQFLEQTPDVGDKVDLFAFGFTSRMFQGGSLDIREAANKLDERLRFDGVWDYDTVVLVGHSMGGLVAMRTLVTHPELRHKVPLLVLYASPQEGSQITAIARMAADNNALQQMLPADRSEFLKDLDDTWSKIPDDERPSVVCAYETMPTHGVQIVARSSATRYCGSERIAIGGTDHISIVKPDNARSDAVVVLVNALRKYVLGTTHTPRLEMPDFAPEGDHLAYTLGDLQAEGIARLLNQGGGRLRFTIVPPANPKLMILPADTPRDIDSGQQQELRFNLLLRGRSDPDYPFTLKTQGEPDRIVVVHVPEYQQAAAQQAARIQGMGEAVEAYLASDENVERLKAMPIEDQRTTVAGVARDALIRETPGLPVETGWILAADALSSAGWPELATSALRSAEAVSPAAVRTPSVQVLAKAIAVESGDKVLQATPERDIAPEELAPFRSERPLRDSRQLDAWQRLSTRMVTVPALQQEALVLRGDVLREQGKTEAAEAAYVQADEVKSTPSSKSRIRAAQAVRRETVDP